MHGNGELRDRQKTVLVWRLLGGRVIRFGHSSEGRGGGAEFVNLPGGDTQIPSNTNYQQKTK